LRLLKLIIQKRGWKEVFDLKADIFWSGLNLNSNDFILVKNIYNNRIPYLSELAQKRFTAFFLNKFLSYFPESFDFYPQTFLLPQDFERLKKFKTENKKTLLIAKPTSGSQGDGIILFKTLKDLEYFLNTSSNDSEYVVQEYIKNPLLLEQKKFDLRFYVLISSLNPLRVWIHDQALARFCTENYQKPKKENLRNVYMHLSNYSLNKNNKNYIYDEECQGKTQATKRTLESLWKNFEEENILDKKDQILEDIEILVKKFIISMFPFINYYSKLQYGDSQDLSGLKNFHIIGFDIMLNSEFKPYLLEINANPSLSIEHDPNYVKLIEISPVDYFVKEKVVEDCLDILNLKSSEKNLLEEGEKFKGYKLLINGNIPEMQDMDVFMKILEAFEKISGGTRFKGIINSTKFLRLHGSIGKISDKFTRNDFDIIYRNIVKFGNGMQFYGFIYAIELITDKIFSNNNINGKDHKTEVWDPKERLSQVMSVVNAILV